MARKKAPSNQGAVWTMKDFAVIRRLVKTGATGKTIAKKIGRSVVALYQKALKKYFPEAQPNFVSLEGYVDAVVMVEGLKRAVKAVDPQGFVVVMPAAEIAGRGFMPLDDE